MQTSFLQRFDWLLGPPACWFAILFPKLAPAQPPKTLIIRPGGMGDFICADIALQELGLDARNFTWLIAARSRPWARFRKIPHVCYDEKPREAMSRVMSRFSLVINTEQRFGLAEAYALACRSRRARVASFQSNRGSSWSNVRVPYDRKDTHETVEFARLFAAALEVEKEVGLCAPRPRVEPPTAPPLVMIAGRQSALRGLSLEAWATLISQWHRERPFLVAASPPDADFAAQLIGRFAGLASGFTGSFDELCRQIARSEEIFTVEGGAVQIASWFGVPTCAVFSKDREKKWGPLGEGSRVLSE